MRSGRSVIERRSTRLDIAASDPTGTVYRHPFRTAISGAARVRGVGMDRRIDA
jgi:hypothetical protein